MPERKPEAWETSKPGPYAFLDRPRGTVTITALGNQQHLVKSTELGIEETIIGHDPAHARADELAAQLE